MRDGVVGLWSLVVGVLIAAWEYKKGYPRSGKGFPFRGLLYLIAVTPGIFTLPTRLASCLFLIPIFFHFYSAKQGEWHEVMIVHRFRVYDSILTCAWRHEYPFVPHIVKSISTASACARPRPGQG